MLTYGTYAVPRADLGEAFHEFLPEGMTLIADAVLPAYSVGKEDGTISVITRENIRLDETQRAEGGTFNRIGMTAEDLAYATTDHGLEIPVTDRERRKYEDDFQVELEKTTILKLRMKLQREKRVKDLVFNTTTWTGASLYTDVTTDWDSADATIISDVEAGKEKVRANCGIYPNALIISAATLKNIRMNTGIKNQFPGIAVLTRDVLIASLPAIFGIPNLLVASSVYNTADEGQSFSGSDVWPDDYAMLAVVATPNAPITTPCIGRTLRWSAIVDNPEAIEQYREEQTKSDILRNEDYLQEKIFDPYFGHLLKVDT